MKQISTALEIAIFGIASMLGLFMLYEATANQDTLLLIGGALCFTLALRSLVLGIRSVLWHRQMLQQSPLDREANEK